MKKLVFTVLAAALLLTNINLKAQDSKGGTNGFKFGIGVEGALPVSGLKSTYDYGAGLTLRGSMGVAENIDVTLTSGFIAFMPKGTLTTSSKAAFWIPIKAGGRLMISDNFYAMAEAGVTIAKTYGLTGITGTTPTYGFVNSTEFTYAPGVGVKFGGFDVGVRYEGINSTGFIGARVGFTF